MSGEEARLEKEEREKSAYGPGGWILGFPVALGHDSGGLSVDMHKTRCSMHKRSVCYLLTIDAGLSSSTC